ncbi:SUKH-3 domain-containing protein (plasmid) [Streptomyces sp. NBC_01343]|uniref:SUKH-3 domain-containing protein n=1 Tax=Streptomyces sp. NBC_01343 TaxID=2903832 RepID=UPI002E139038|nr:SUKH-3 domain-containing protein [Streptomyces sp. NBC_01343]
MRELCGASLSLQDRFQDEILMMPRFSSEIEGALRAAGWFPGRQVDISAWRNSMQGFPMHVAAEEILREFGGIHVQVSGPGVTCMRTPFEFDPELAVGEEDRFLELSRRFDCSLFPVGMKDSGDFFLAIDEDGTVYALMNWLFSLGHGDDALERLVTGVAGERVRTP